MQLPELQNSTKTAIFKWYEQHGDNEPRAHLGASEIGHPCDRYLWLNFRWAKKNAFDGRMQRLFETGHLEEDRIIKNLKDINVEVWQKDDTGKQFSFSAVGGHFGGSLDGVAKGLLEAPKTPHLLECKTSNAKQFAQLVKHGIAFAKPQHYAQMQVYMHLAELSRGIYIAVCKDTDELHIERVIYDKSKAIQFLQRAENIITLPEPPVTLADEPSHFTCKFCKFKDQCYGTEAPEVNCRTCAHSTPEIDGNARWSCAQAKPDMDVSKQRKGCEEHRHIPVLLGRFAELMDATSNNLITYRNRVNKNEFNQPQYSSQEITDLQDKAILGDTVVAEFKETFDATIVPESPVGVEPTIYNMRSDLEPVYGKIKKNKVKS